MEHEGAEPRNRPHGPWFGWLFVAAGVLSVVVAAAPFLGWDPGGTGGGSFLGVLVGLVFVAAGGAIVVIDLRSHGHATPPARTRAALVAAGWEDITEEVRTAGLAALPSPVRAVLRPAHGNAWVPHGTVARLARLHPTGLHGAGRLRTELDGEIRVAESWIITSTSSTNDRVTGGTVEPRVAAWTPLPAAVGRVTIRPDSARMRLADLTGLRTDHEVEWEAVDETWHLHGDDVPLLRAVVDIGLMGRLAELPGRWVVRFDGPWLVVVATADRGALTAKPPTLAEVAHEIGEVVVAVRSILPQMLWRDLDRFLAAYRG